MNLKHIFAGVFALSIIAAVVFGYLYFNERSDHSADNQVNTQKVQGLVDQLTQKGDSLQVLAIRVGDLNSQVEKELYKKGYWIAIASEYKTALDSIRLSGVGTDIVGEDTLGKYYQVKFAGKDKFVSYFGLTRYYPLPVSKGIWNLKLDFDTIDIVSDLFKDTDNLIKIRVESKTPGIKIKSYSTVDSTLLKNLFLGMSFPTQEIQTDWGILANLSASHILPQFVDASVGAYYGGITTKYFIKEKTFWVDVTGKFSIKDFKFRW